MNDSVGEIVPVLAAIRVLIGSTVGGHITILVARGVHFLVAELHVFLVRFTFLSDELAALVQTPGDFISHGKLDTIPS
jgi:hypothetical protein